MAEIAQAYVQVIPTTKGIKSDLEKIMGDDAAQAGKSAGEKFSESFSSSLQGVGGKLESAGKTISGKLGSSLTKYVTAPLAGIGTAATAAVTQFEGSFTKLSTIADTSGAKGSESLDNLRESIKALSDQTGMSQSQIAEAAYSAISAGRSTSEAVGFVEQANQLATAGFTSIETATDTLTTALNAYGMSADQVSSISDKLITTQNLGKTTVDELGASLGKVIPTAAMYGVNLDQLSAAYVTTTKNGIATAESTTYINGMLNELGKSGSTASDTLKEKTGKTFKELMDDGNSLSDVLNILQESATESGLSMADMFGSQEAAKAAATITQHTNDFDSALQTLTTQSGVTKQAFDNIMANDPAKQWDKIKTSVQNAAITLGNSLLPVLEPVVSQLTSGIQKVSDAWSKLDPQTQQAIVKAGLVAAAAGPVVTIFGKLTTGVGTLIKTGGSVVSFFGNLGEKAGSVAGSVGSAASSISSAGSAAGGAAGGVASAATSFGQLAGQALSLVALGGGIALAGVGIKQIADAAVAVGQAGPAAQVAMVAMTAAVAGLAVGAAALGPALTAGSIGFVAFGASVALIGGGIDLATSGIAKLAAQLPNVSTYGSSAALALTQIGLAMTVTSAGALTLAAGMTSVLLPFAGSAATIGLTDAALVGLTATLGASTLAAGALGLAMTGVATQVESISTSATAAGSSLQAMVTSVSVVNTAVDAMKTKFSELGTAFVNVFTKATPSASAAAASMVNTTAATMTASFVKITNAVSNAGTQANTQWNTKLIQMNTQTRTGMNRVESTVKTSLNTVVRDFSDLDLKTPFGRAIGQVNQEAGTQMNNVRSTIKGYLSQIEQDFANTKLEFNQHIRLPHFSMSGSFDAETGAVPSVNVNWYRKAYDDAFVLNKPTIFGAMNGKLLGGGDGRGSELVIGTDKLIETIQKAVGNAGYTQNITINSPKQLDPSETARQARNASRQMVLALKGML